MGIWNLPQTLERLGQKGGMREAEEKECIKGIKPWRLIADASQG